MIPAYDDSPHRQKAGRELTAADEQRRRTRMKTRCLSAFIRVHRRLTMISAYADSPQAGKE
jgi:hypothetical protein